MEITRLTHADLIGRRTAALKRLGMDLETARAQWADCGCCLEATNFDDLADLEAVKDADYLLNESTN